MPGNHGNSTLSPNRFYAEGALGILSEFTDAFRDQGELKQLREIVSQDEEFRGGVVGQMPERFTEENLICPMLDVLGYQNITPQPADLVRDQRSIPDFRIEADKSCVCIVESKKLGTLPEPNSAETEVEEQVEDYLGENALTKYKRDLDTQYLVGIGTDGIVWFLYGKDLNSGNQTAVHAASLRETFNQAVLSKRYEDTINESWNVKHRKILAEDFTPLFTADGISNAVMSEL